MNDTTETSRSFLRRRSTLSFGLMAVIGFTVYVVGAGPLVKWARGSGNPGVIQVVQQVVRPLEVVAMKIPVVGDHYLRYLNGWAPT